MDASSVQTNLHLKEKTSPEHVTSFSSFNRGQSSREECKFFSKYNFCKFGSSCRYYHRRKTFAPRYYVPTRFKSHSNQPKTFSTNTSSDSTNFASEHNGNLSNIDDIAPQDDIFPNVACQAEIGVASTCNDFKECITCVDTNIAEKGSDLLQSKDSMDKTIKLKEKRRWAPICRFYRRGHCDLGDTCRFFHPVNKAVIKNKLPELSESSLSTLPDQENGLIPATVEASSKVDLPKTNLNNTFVRKTLFDASENTEESISDLRNTEIVQLKKRYPKSEYDEDNDVYLIIFEPTDPDWPFDLKSLHLEISFPLKYPTEVCRICVLRSASNIPEILVRFLNRSIDEWLSQRHAQTTSCEKVELVFRHFLKWFDKNLEELFICGLRKVKQDIEAKKHGIEFIPVEQLFSSQCNISEETPATEPSTCTTTTFDIPTTVSEPSNKDNNPPTTNPKPAKRPNANVYNALNQGTKILFSNIDFIEGVGALTCTKLSAMLQCSRCKTSFSTSALPSKKRSHRCEKCGRNLEINLEPSIMHQFSGVLGTLFLTDCHIIDVNLVECVFLADCLNCSKQVSLDGIHYGSKQRFWCMNCNEKFVISVEVARFQALKPTLAAQNVSMKKKEKAKDPLIREGEPLPANGTCKHYKKSFRWLRFPCCGRVYPCDICHDEKEGGHEMKFASRMICGFCSKEQPYGKDKSCTSCSASVTAKGGSHWEGGKGCRNKVKMARDDKHKYVGTNKTVAKKGQTVKSPAKK